ncbi:MAG: OmpA family protein [Bacteroidota bacterium]
MTKRLLSLPLLLLAFWCSAQQTASKSIYFDSNQHQLSETAKLELIEWINEFEVLSIQLSGHTDEVGSREDNLLLSQRRVQTLADHLVSLGIDRENIQTDHQGEDIPIASNATEEGKAQNRRVDIILTHRSAPLATNAQPEASEEQTPQKSATQARAIQLQNQQLYEYLQQENPWQLFRISIQQDTVLTTHDGLLFCFSKASFQADCNDSLTIAIREYNSKSAAVKANLQTVSNKRRLQSVGMFDIRAYCGEQEASLKVGKNYTVMVPVDIGEEAQKDVKCFYGYRDSVSNEVNWIPEPYKRVSFFPGTMLCGGFLKEDNRCFVQKIFSGGRKREIRRQNREINNERKKIRNKFKNVNFDAVGDLPTKDLQYYVFQPKKTRLVNFDIFLKEEAPQLLVQRILLNEPISDNTDVKVVFKERRSILSATQRTDQYFEFNGLPKDEKVYIVALKMGSSKRIQLAIQEYKLDGQDATVELEEVQSFAELDQRLRLIN